MGLSMSLALLRRLGLKRSFRVFKAIATISGERAGGGVARRTFLGVLSAGLLASGFPAFPSFADSGSSSGALRGRELEQVESELLRILKIQEARKKMKGLGYSLVDYKLVVLPDRLRNSFVAMFFHGHVKALESRAAVLTYDSTNGQVVVEFVSDGSGSLRGSGSLDLSSLTVQPLGASQYFGCLASCVGANCASQASRCSRLRFMYLILACMVVYCGSKVRVCHRVCKKEW